MNDEMAAVRALSRKRMVRIAKLETCIRAIKMGADNQDAHAGMSWQQVSEICKIALEV